MVSDSGLGTFFVIRNSAFVISLADPPAKWVPVVQQQRRLSSDKCGADDGRHDHARWPVEPAIARGEKTAVDALLHPHLAFVEFVLGGQARKLRARAGAARRAVVSFARTKDKVTRTRPGIGRRAEQLDMVHLRKTLRVDRLPDAPGEVSERLDIRQFQRLSVL